MKKVAILISLSTFLVTIGLIFLFTGRNDSIIPDKKNNYYYKSITNDNGGFKSVLFDKIDAYPVDINSLDNSCSSYTISNKFYHYVNGVMTRVGDSELTYNGIESFNSLYVHNNTGKLTISCNELFKIIIPTDDKFLGDTYRSINYLLDNKYYELIGSLSSNINDKNYFDQIIKDSGGPSHIYKVKDKDVFYYNWEADSYIISFIIIDNPDFGTFEIEEYHYIPFNYYSIDENNLEIVK